MANNSVVLLRHKATESFFNGLWGNVKASGFGEPGFYWTHDKEWGTNPCCEIALRPNTFCNLCELNGSNLESTDDFNNRNRVAAFFGTLQAGFTDFHYLRDVWKRNTEKDALIGVGITGICNGVINNYTAEELEFGANVVKQENMRVADLIGINIAARCTTVKPSGCRPATTDSLVTTEEGIFTLPELFTDHKGSGFCNINEDYTASANGNKLSKTFNNGIAPVYKIELEGQIVLKSTGNHPWYVKERYSKKKYEDVNDFVETNDLKKGHILDINLGIYEGTPFELKEMNLFPYYMNDNNVNILFPKEMNNDLSWLIGYIDGDGHIDSLKYRFRFTDEHKYNLDKVKQIFKDQFNLDCTIKKCTDRNAYILEKASVVLFEWFMKNKLITKYSDSQTISIAIRKSTKEHIISYFSGLIDSDGCVRNVNGKLGFTISQKLSDITRHWQQVALCVGIHINHSLNVKRGVGAYSDSTMVLLSNTGFSKKESMVIIAKNSNKLSMCDLPLHCDENSKVNQIFGKVKSVTLIGDMPTYDIEIENDPWFYAGAIKSHNTSSCVLGTSSGIHAWHSEYYIRNIQCAVGDDLYNFFTENHPELIKVMEWDPNSAVIACPQHSPKGAVLREDETALDMLERVNLFNMNWVKKGYNSGQNHNNVSATVSVKEDEWVSVGKWMWDKRENYNGLSVLPYDGGEYKNAPFQTCTKEEYERLMNIIDKNPIDLTKIVEEEDNTNLNDQVACAGGACEVKF